MKTTNEENKICTMKVSPILTTNAPGTGGTDCHLPPVKTSSPYSSSSWCGMVNATGSVCGPVPCVSSGCVQQG
jgi:hypothetical protein